MNRDARISANLRRCALAAVASCACVLAHASADDFVFDPYAEDGARVLQYTRGAERGRDGSSEAAQSIALAWSPTARWFTAAYADWYREPGEPLRFYGFYWTNHVALTAPSLPYRVGFYLEVERPKDRDEGYGFTWGPTLQFDVPHGQVVLNLWLQRDVRTEHAAPTALVYQWQFKRLAIAHVELGFQGFGNVGPWHRWADASAQEHTVGPAVFAKWPQGGDRVLRMDAAALVGVGAGSPRGTLRLRTEYQF